MKDCENCERRFSCFTEKEGDVCPTILGTEIIGCFPYYNNVACSTDEYFPKLRIRPEQMLKLLRRANFRTVKKYNRVYLEVIDEA